MFKIIPVRELDKYNKNQENRLINKNHVNDFKDVLRKGNFIKNLAFGLNPIIVNPISLNVLEGQHRKEAILSSLKDGIIPDTLEVLVGEWAIDDEKDEKELIISLNTKTKNWTLEDYLNSYAQTQEAYKNLKDFCKNHELCSLIKNNGTITTYYRYAVAMAKGKTETKNLKRGDFTISETDLLMAHIIHDEVVRIRKKLGIHYKHKNNEIIIRDCSIEPLSIIWFHKRNEISINDIEKLKNIPSSVIKNPKKNKDDWDTVFYKLSEQIKKEKNN